MHVCCCRLLVAINVSMVDVTGFWRSHVLCLHNPALLLPCALPVLSHGPSQALAHCWVMCASAHEHQCGLLQVLELPNKLQIHLQVDTFELGGS
jgi:hypothetical protein